MLLNPLDHKKIAAINPKMCYFKGDLSLLDAPAVYFGGVRDARNEDLDETYQMAYALAQEGWVIVSGAARGVDDAAHCGALDADGRTIILPVEGLNVFNFKYQLKERKENIRIDNGKVLLLSFCPLDSQWFTGYALSRNRYCLQLSQAMISVQSKTHGGTYSASTSALKMKVPLYVLAPSDGRLSDGAQYFISKGAKTISLDTVKCFETDSSRKNSLF